MMPVKGVGTVRIRSRERCTSRRNAVDRAMNDWATSDATRLPGPPWWLRHATLMGAAVLLVSLVACAPGSAVARNAYMDHIPNGEEFGCDTCHLQLPWLNAFGQDVGRTFPLGTVQWAKVYALDSDGDGQSNGFELGDPCGEWVIGDLDADRAENLSAPSLAESVVSDKALADDCPEPAGDDDDSAVVPDGGDQCGYSLALASHPVEGHSMLLALALISWSSRRSRRRRVSGSAGATP